MGKLVRLTQAERVLRRANHVAWMPPFIGLFAMANGPQNAEFVGAAIFIGGLVIWVTSGLFEGALNLRSELRLRAAGFLVCNCGYDLCGHGETGVCPECGRSYTGKQLEQEWCAIYKTHSTDQPVRARQNSR